ncbi:hypothetical protein IV203_013716 [Nitzschia inconspicua]|uniref:Uncharacterized protein n=1 Tax=Nitzschia inconspicua TaxID=303405 RepID=A0A9K3Q883_9STRA|nr:hypothetical protein IV203_013716 [Nitzschia inconspicua]
MMHLRSLTTSNYSAEQHPIMEDTWCELHDGSTIVSKDWTHLSINSDEINKAASPFDDIGYLATDNAPSKSFNMKGCNTPVDPPTPLSNKGNKEHNESTADNASTGPTLKDFFQRDKLPPITAEQRQLNQDIISKASSRFPFRRFQKVGSRRGDIFNVGKNNNSCNNNLDDDSIGISTIISMNTTKRTNRMLEISKGSLTLSMLGASKLSCKNKYNDSKSRGTRTTEASSSHTKSTMASTFGSSMFSRDSSKTKERLREMVEQLEGANQTLVSENQLLKSRVEEVEEAWTEASFYKAWFSIQELAEIQTELCQLRAFKNRALQEQNELELEVKHLHITIDQQKEEIEDFKTMNQAQADRIAYLESKLLENQLDPSHHHQVVACGNPATVSMADSFGSFDSFGITAEEEELEQDDEEWYEERLNGESEKSESAHDDVFKTFRHDKALELSNPPPPPSSPHCMTDPCTSFRKRAHGIPRTSSKSPGQGNRRKNQEVLLKTGSTDASNVSSAGGAGPVISTSRVSQIRRSRSTSVGSRAKSVGATRELRGSDGARMRPSKSFSGTDKNGATSGLTKQPSRRRIKNTNLSSDCLDSSQHSNKSARSIKSARSSGAARRRAVGKSLTDSLGGTGSNHSIKSASRRRLRNSAVAESDRGAVRDALDRFVGEEKDVFSRSMGAGDPMAAPRTDRLRRNKSGNFADLVCSTPMALVQDRAMSHTETRMQPKVTSAWAMSA